MTAPTADPANGPAVLTADPDRGSAALTLRLVARRHVDLHRVCSALCRSR